MFLLLPLGTDNPIRRRPLANYALIAVNLAVFLLTLPYTYERVGLGAQRAYRSFLLHPETPQLYQFITYAFLHGGVMHVLGNMLFLYIFGNSVNDRLGHAGYVLLYLAGGVASGIGHCLANSSPVLGASGAIAAVTGAYLVLFPQTSVHTFYWILYFIGRADFSALYFILFKLIAYDTVIEPRLGGPSNVAYTAHLAGYAFGIAVPLLLLVVKVLPHSPYDLWALVRRWRRRQEYRRLASRGHDPFGAGRVRVDAKVVAADAPNPHADQIMSLRAQIARAVNGFDLAAAADAYLRLLELDPRQVLPEQQQLDVANKLMQMGHHPAAARAYEDFVARYPKYPLLEQVQLMLGLLYSRYLDHPDRARPHLHAALAKLAEPAQRQMAQDELDRL